MQPSQRIRGIVGDGSDGWEVYYAARARIAAGDPVINLTVGDHDIGTASDVIDAMARSAHGGKLGYSPVPGSPELRAAVAARIAAHTGVATTADNVIVTPGGQAGLFAAMQATLDPGDRCLLIDPWYANFPLTVRAAGAIPVDVPARSETGFTPDPADIDAAAATTGARAILLNSPNNPTGAVYDLGLLREIGAVCVARDLWVLSDELYETQVYEGVHASPRAVAGLEERTLVVGSFSKSHAMTGWRCGWVVAAPEMTTLLGDLANTTTYGIPGFIMDAALHALGSEDGTDAAIAARYRRRRDAALEALSGAAAVRASRPAGGMYLMLDIRPTGLSGHAFAAGLLDAENVAVMPGESFGAAGAGHLRVALTAPEDRLVEAMTRLVRFAETRRAA